MTTFVLAPGERISGFGAQVVDPGFGGDTTTMAVTDISAESAQWMLTEPWNPDPNEGYPWLSYQVAYLYLPCEFTTNIHDVDLDTGEELFVRNQQTIDGIFGIKLE
jgi:hypothetical protein